MIPWLLFWLLMLLDGTCDDVWWLDGSWACVIVRVIT